MTQAAVCPACVGLPETAIQNATKADHLDQQVSLPGIHCVACITGVEQALLTLPGVSSARVNLSLRRVTVRTAPTLAPEVLIERLVGSGFDAQLLDQGLLGSQSDTVGRALLTYMAVAGFAMMNVMLLSVAIWSGAIGATQSLFHMISASIAVPALLFSARPFFHSAASALRARRLNMDVPISLAIILAGGMSTYETLAGGQHAYFDAALSLTFFLLLGRYLDHQSRRAARSAAAQLAALEVPRVQRIVDGAPETINFADLAVGDTIQVLPGGRIPVDGVVTKGAGPIDRSMITGESRPAQVAVGDIVTSGEISQSAPLHIRATTVGQDTTLRKMAQMVEAGENSRNKYNAIADRAARVYAPLVHLLALAAFVVWTWASGDLRLALNIAIAVLIITCPCALGLAVPAVSTAATARLFRAGMLVKDGTAVERIADVDTVVFDKTGTLTLPTGGPTGLPNAQAKSILLALAQQSTHPTATAIEAALDGATADISEVSEIAGQGVSGVWQGLPVTLGARRHMDGGEGAALRIGDDIWPLSVWSELRPGALDLIRGWQKAGLDLHIVSGDSSAETARVATDLGVTNWQASTSPAEKVAYLDALAARGKTVLMVGDGLNDTGALAAAHVSLSPASAADASRAASDIVFLGDSLASLTELPLTARQAKRRIIENFAIAAGYNMIAIPIALAGFATPLMAAIAMSVSSITVVLNALRVRA